MIDADAQNISNVRAADMDGDGDLDVLAKFSSEGSVAWYENLGNGAYSPRPVVAKLRVSPSTIGVADLDEDGDLDLLGLARSQMRWGVKVVWYENLGFESFAPQRDLAIQHVIGATAMGDVDGDGDIDVLSASRNSEEGEVFLHRNLGGGEFSSGRQYGPEGRFILSIHLSDLNGDGDPDLLMSAAGGDRIVWYENKERRYFGQPQVIAADAALVHDVFAEDLDGDGDMDVLSASFGSGEIAWYENRGAGEFSPERIITADAKGATGVHAVDIDGDGDIDLLSAFNPAGKIAWHENLGAGEFSPRRDITADDDSAKGFHLADLDGDDDFDVLSNSPTDNRIIWYENTGGGGFSPQRTVAANSDGVTYVHAADLDGDGDLDVMSASPDKDMIAWYSNQGAGEYSPQRLITTDARKVGSVSAVDMDVDGDFDVLWASPEHFASAWIENPGDGNFATHRAITSDSGGSVQSVLPADLDGDGDLDVLTQTIQRYDTTLAWLENLGDGELSSERFIAETARSVLNANAVDLDGDGDLDVLLTSETPGRSIDWYENQGDGIYLPHPIHAADSRYISTARVADIDGDGDPDVYTYKREIDERKIAWFENRGRGMFTSEQVLVRLSESYSEVFATDLNGDGDFDLLTVSFAGKIEWYENLGVGGFSSRRMIEPDAGSIGKALPVDLDGDDDIDVLYASRYDNNYVAWRENQGGGVFSTRRDFEMIVEGEVSVYAADMDGDGDLDVLSASTDNNKIAWSENLGAGEFSPEKIITTVAPNVVDVTVADLDGDGDLDVLSASSHGRTRVLYENSGGGIFTSHRALGPEGVRSIFFY